MENRYSTDSSGENFFILPYSSWRFSSKTENVGHPLDSLSTVVVIFAVHNYLLVILHRPPIYFLIYSFELI